MTKQQLGLENFSQRISTGKLTVDIGNRTRIGENPTELVDKLSKIRQLNKIFDFEYSKTNSDLELLQKVIFLINFYINNYRIKGNQIINDIEIVPAGTNTSNFIVVATTGNVTFLSLLDVIPKSYGGQAGKLVRVNYNETGLEFVDSAEGRPMEKTLKWSDLISTGAEGRKRYENNNWINWNPQLFVDSAIGLLVYDDYDVLPNGGFELKSTGNVPLIYNEQIIRAVGFERFTITPLPIIIVQPQSQSVLQGTSVTLTVTTSNAGSFQWYKDGVSISGAIGSSLTINNFSQSNEATYTVRVTNVAGYVVSNGAVLTRTIFYNVVRSGTATRNNCQGAGETGTTVTYTVNAGTYTSYISQIDADNQAQLDVDNNKQAYANANGTCIPPITYSNAAVTRFATRNNCPSGQQGSSVGYTIAAGTYTSIISQADADNQAIAAAEAGKQAYANTNGVCTVIPMFGNVEVSQDFTRNNCTGQAIGSVVTYTVFANTYMRPSQEDADNAAAQDIIANGQNYANANGTCTVPPTPVNLTINGFWVGPPESEFVVNAALEEALTQNTSIGCIVYYIDAQGNSFNTMTGVIQIPAGNTFGNVIIIPNIPGDESYTVTEIEITFINPNPNGGRLIVY